MNNAIKPLDTLSNFVRDVEHELLSVITALQAHIDLLHDEQILNHMPVERFAILNRAVKRLIDDTSALASVAELAHLPRSTSKSLLEKLMQEITDETSSAFSASQVSLSCDIALGTTLVGNAASLKLMLTGMVLAVLYKCRKLETVRIIGLKEKDSVTLSFDNGADDQGDYKPWRLGELRLIPMNGEGISLSAVNALAQLHDGQLSVSTHLDQRQGFKLIFKN